MVKNPGGASGSIVVVSSQLGLEGKNFKFFLEIPLIISLGAPGLSAYSASKVTTETHPLMPCNDVLRIR